MDWDKQFQVFNKSNKILISGVVTLAADSTTVIDPHRYPPRLVNDLKIYEKRNYIEVTNEISVSAPATKNAFAVKTLDSGGGKKAISVEPIDLGSRAITVETTTNELKQETKAPADEDKLSREQAVQLLNAHWKKVESEVNKITDARKLNLLQVVAQEEGVADKKKEIIEARLKEI